jgi:hypothetical protein
VKCYITEDAVSIGNSFYYNLISRHFKYFYTVTHLHSLQSVQSNIPNLFGASGIHLETADRSSCLQDNPFARSSRKTVALLLRCLSLSLMLRPTVSRPVCLGIKHPSGAYDQIFISVRKTEYVWQLRSWIRGAPSLTRGRVCLLYVPLALASAVFLAEHFLITILHGPRREHRLYC